MARNEQPIMVMNDEDGTDCAWCMQHQNVPLGDGSHGICDEHAELQYMRYHISKVPSAVDRQAVESKKRSLFW